VPQFLTFVLALTGSGTYENHYFSSVHSQEEENKVVQNPNENRSGISLDTFSSAFRNIVAVVKYYTHLLKPL
jgi:hypothetical protein